MQTKLLEIGNSLTVTALFFFSLMSRSSSCTCTYMLEKRGTVENRRSYTSSDYQVLIINILCASFLISVDFCTCDKTLVVTRKPVTRWHWSYFLCLCTLFFQTLWQLNDVWAVIEQRQIQGINKPATLTSAPLIAGVKCTVSTWGVVFSNDSGLKLQSHLTWDGMLIVLIFIRLKPDVGGC